MTPDPLLDIAEPIKVGETDRCETCGAPNPDLCQCPEPRICPDCGADEAFGQDCTCWEA